MVSRSDFIQMVRAVRAGSSWEQVRAAWAYLDADWLDANVKDSVLSTAGVVPPSPVVEEEPIPSKRGRKKE